MPALKFMFFCSFYEPGTERVLQIREDACDGANIRTLSFDADHQWLELSLLLLSVVDAQNGTTQPNETVRVLEYLLLLRIVLDSHVAEVYAGDYVLLNGTYRLGGQHFHEILVLVDVVVHSLGRTTHSKEHLIRVQEVLTTLQLHFLVSCVLLFRCFQDRANDASHVRASECQISINFPRKAGKDKIGHIEFIHFPVHIVLESSATIPRHVLVKLFCFIQRYANAGEELP